MLSISNTKRLNYTVEILNKDVDSLENSIVQEETQRFSVDTDIYRNIKTAVAGLKQKFIQILFLQCSIIT
jgi:hypothetical protein